VSETSEETQRQIDEEVHRLVEGSRQHVTRLLTDHRDQLESLAQALLKAETLDAIDAYAAAGVPAHVEQNGSAREPVLTSPARTRA
jgi:cell division protease FtsH